MRGLTKGTVLVDGRPNGERCRQRTISISVFSWAVRRGRSAAVVAEAEYLLAAIPSRTSCADPEAAAG